MQLGCYNWSTPLWCQEEKQSLSSRLGQVVTSLSWQWLWSFGLLELIQFTKITHPKIGKDQVAGGKLKWSEVSPSPSTKPLGFVSHFVRPHPDCVPFLCTGTTVCLNIQQNESNKTCSKEQQICTPSLIASAMLEWQKAATVTSQKLQHLKDDISYIHLKNTVSLTLPSTQSM